MFTGIVNGTCQIKALNFERGEFGRLTVEAEEFLMRDLHLGDSVAVDGVCLTASQISERGVDFDVIKSTIRRSIIINYIPGSKVNIERSLRVGAEIGGHEVSGHVDLQATVERIEATPGNRCLFFRIPLNMGRYIFPCGFIAINGVSLTVSDCLEGGSLFSVWLIPETLRVTNLGELAVGHRANLEIHRGIQVLVDTLEASVKRFLEDFVANGKGGQLDRVEALKKLSQFNIPKLLNPGSSTD